MRNHIKLTVACVALAAIVANRAYAAEIRLKRLDSGGRVPARYVLPKPPRVAHPDVAPSGSKGIAAMGLGTNNITFDTFDSGDIVVVGGLDSFTGHAGLFDRSLYNGTLSCAAVWSANTMPRNGVQREYCSKYRMYDSAYALWVPRHQEHASSARWYCRYQNGEPFDIMSSKSDQSRWYCSKLCWAAWRRTAGVDLDADGGYWVWPMDMVWDSDTVVFGHWT